MDSNQQIIKTHKALVNSLIKEELTVFSQLTNEHQKFIISFFVREPTLYPDKKILESFIKDDIKSCIEHIKENILKINTASEAMEEWESWLFLKSSAREVMDIRDIARLLFVPYETALNEKRLSIRETAENVLAGFWVTEEYIEPYFYPWQTAMRNILFNKNDLPSFDAWTQKDRRMFFSELPLDKKKYACIHINDLEHASKRLPKDGRLHLGKIFQVWRSYLPNKRPSTDDKDQERREIYQQVVHELGIKNHKGILLKEAAKRAVCSEKTMRRAISPKR